MNKKLYFLNTINLLNDSKEVKLELRIQMIKILRKRMKLMLLTIHIINLKKN
jgi:hypothetical protein